MVLKLCIPPQVVAVPSPGRRSVTRKEVKSTLTRYRLLGAAGGCALLQLQPRTGECPPYTAPVPPPHSATHPTSFPPCSFPRAAPGAPDAAAVPGTG